MVMLIKAPSIRGGEGRKLPNPSPCNRGLYAAWKKGHSPPGKEKVVGAPPGALHPQEGTFREGEHPTSLPNCF